MKKKFSELSLEEFTRVLCGMEGNYSLSLTLFLNSGDKVCEAIDGTYSELYDFCMGELAKYPDNKKVQASLKELEENAFDYDVDFETLDINDYLENKTKGFQKDRCSIVLRDLKYYHLNINEEREKYVEEKILQGWKDYKVRKIKGPDSGSLAGIIGDIDVIDYKDAYNKIYGYYYDYYYLYAIKVLESKVEQIDEVKFPPELDNPQTKKYFDRALKAGYMELSNAGLKWNAIGGKGGNSQLGYFCSKVYSPPRPISALENLFKVTRLSSYITNAGLDVRRADTIKWRNDVDKLFQD
ncbi:MAG: hypothetical protein DBY00_04355 [Flavobacteriales bacterium]|nr:MAG: hypothetical protein DBY00_04355 [Flavobacteriales bacterium]